MNILYITRKFPPSIGGMQTQSAQFYANLSRYNKVFLISWGGSQAFLFIFFIIASIKAILLLTRYKIDVVQLGDLVLSPLVALTRSIFKIPTLAVSHGRDSAYSNLLYNRVILESVKRLDRVVCVSKNMKNRLIARGIPESILEVIPNGIAIKEFSRANNSKEMLLSDIKAAYDVDLSNKRVIISASRLVRKKGITEFIENVFKKISGETASLTYLIIGDGPEKDKIATAIKSNDLNNCVYMLGSVEHNSYIYKALFTIADLFIMPNIKVADDAEGFGIVVLEAALMQVPVIAYNVDGISEAVHDGENGMLVDENDYARFASDVTRLLSNEKLREQCGERSKEYAEKNFNWDLIISKYIKLYYKVSDAA